MRGKRKSLHAVYASILKNPADARILAGFGFLHLASILFGFSAWKCPIFLVTGIPCPGCGLSRATAALLQGDLRTMGKIHIFAPIVLIAVVLTGLTLCVPDKVRINIIELIEKVEKHSKISIFIIISIVIYWALRLFLNPVDYILLMENIY